MPVLPSLSLHHDVKIALPRAGAGTTIISGTINDFVVIGIGRKDLIARLGIILFLGIILRMGQGMLLLMPGICFIIAGGCSSARKSPPSLAVGRGNRR